MFLSKYFISVNQHKRIIKKKNEEIQSLKGTITSLKLLISNLRIGEEKSKRKAKKLERKLERIENLITCNKYNNERAILKKLKELVKDYKKSND